MMMRGLCASLVGLAVVHAHPAARFAQRDCHGGCLETHDTSMSTLGYHLEEVVYVDREGVPVCTITETVWATQLPTGTPVPLPVPTPVPEAKILVHINANTEETTTTTCLDELTTTILVKPLPPTGTPVKPAVFIETSVAECVECEKVQVHEPVVTIIPGGEDCVECEAAHKIAVTTIEEPPTVTILPVGEECVECEAAHKVAVTISEEVHQPIVTIIPDEPCTACEANQSPNVPTVHIVQGTPPTSPACESGNCHQSSSEVTVVEKSKTVVEGGKTITSGGGSSTVSIRSTHGISYAAYRADHGCKSKADIDADFDNIKGKYSVVRTYGVDCNQVEYIHEAAKRIDVKVFFGIWDINSVETEVQTLIAGLGGDFSIVDTVSVGNELVNNGEASAEQVISAVNQCRSLLRSAGYQGPVVAVDTFIATEANPQLCDESDYCAINAHAFFDSTISAEQTGPWLLQTIQSVQSKLSSPGKKIIITETGWPTQGAANGLAIPGLENQKLALESISESFADSPGDVILFSAFNDLWKGEADKYWGIGGAVSSCDQ